MGDHTAFFYGTLMAPGVLHRVIYGTHSPEEWQKKLTTVRPAILSAHRRHRVRHADFPAVVPEPGSVVQGTYVTGLTDGDLYRLDIFEGDMYTRSQVEVHILRQDLPLDEKVDLQNLDALVEGQAVTQTYVWTDGRDQLEDEEWDFEQFKRDRMEAWMGLARDGKEEDVDEGFADVDRAVAEEEARLRGQGDTPSGLMADPSGGRVNGKIARDLASAGV